VVGPGCSEPPTLAGQPVDVFHSRRSSNPGTHDGSCRSAAHRTHWREQSIAPLASGAAQTFRIIHPFHPLRGRTFQLVDCRQTWGEDRVYFHDDSGQLARLPLQWTDVVPDDPTVVVGAGRAHFRYHDLCRLADLLTRLDAPLLGERADQEC
jgi:uncharacterized protein DUF5372